jgi:hypothetical protein
MDKELVKEVEELVAIAKEIEEQYVLKKSERTKLELEKSKIEADLLRITCFDSSLKNEQQRTAAFTIGKFKNESWYELASEKLPQLQNECLALYFEHKRIHEQIECRLISNREGEIFERLL